jgi:Surface antigen
MNKVIARVARRAGGLLGILIIAGCSTTGPAVAPLSFAKTPAPNKAEAILAALNGGVLPQQVVSSLSASDRLRALEAEYKALESAPGGLPIEWKSPNGKAAGQVVAATPYQVGRQNCRQYTHQATVSGRQVSGQGAACRNADGSWTPLT